MLEMLSGCNAVVVPQQTAADVDGYGLITVERLPGCNAVDVPQQTAANTEGYGFITVESWLESIN